MLALPLALLVVLASPHPGESTLGVRFAAVNVLDEAEQVRAIEMLAARGEEAVPALIELSQSHHGLAVRGAAVRALGGMGAAGRTAAEPIAKLLVDANSSEELVWTCSRALSALREHAKTGVATLARAFAARTTVVNVRCVAAITLGSLGSTAKDVVPALLACFEETPTTLVQPVAATQLGRIGNASVAPVLKDLRRERPMRQMWRILALAEIGEDAAEASGKLVPIVTTDEWMLHKAVLHALDQMGKSAQRAAERARSEEAQREKGMLKGGICDTTMADRPRAAIELFRSVGIDVAGEVTLPDKLPRDPREHFGIGNVLEGLGDHLAKQLAGGGKAVAAGSIQTHRELEAAFHGVPGLAECLRRFSELPRGPQKRSK